MCYLSQDILILGHSRLPICDFDPMTSASGHSRLYEVILVIIFNFRSNRRALWIIPMCFSHKDATTDMQHDLLGSHLTSHDLDLRSNFDINLLTSTCIYFDAFG